MIFLVDLTVLLMVGLKGLGSHFQPQLFYDSKTTAAMNQLSPEAVHLVDYMAHWCQTMWITEQQLGSSSQGLDRHSIYWTMMEGKKVLLFAVFVLSSRAVSRLYDMSSLLPNWCTLAASLRPPALLSEIRIFRGSEQETFLYSILTAEL